MFTKRKGKDVSKEIASIAILIVGTLQIGLRSTV